MEADKLKEMIRIHKLWLNDKIDGVRADLRDADLIDADLSRADLRDANLRGADLRDADLIDADLSRAKLSRANLRGADLRGADLRGADLRDADLRDADLSRANLDYSSWSLSCNTKNVKLCKKLQAQLLAHAFQVSPDVELPKEINDFIKEHFHRYDEFFTRGRDI